MLKILQARLQQYVKRELPAVQVGFKKTEEPEIKLPTSVGSLKKQESSRKTSTSALLTMPKLWLCSVQFSSVQFSSVAPSCLTLCDPTDCRTPDFPVRYQLPELTQIHVHQVSDAMRPSHPLLFPSPPIFNLPSIRVFSNESVLHIRWSKYWSFSFSISPSTEYSGLISFRIDWLDLLAIQGTLKNVLQHHSSKASIQKQHCMDHNKLWNILQEME